MQKTIYLDYAATTPVDPKVAQKLADFLTLEGVFANPASRSHMYGWQAEAAVEHARKQVANLLNADTREIVWTSGATEANNLAIKGAAELARIQNGKRHIVTSLTEHKAVIDSVAFLESNGYSVTWLAPNSGGYVEPGDVEKAIRADTALISVMHVNNETGVINDVKAIAKIAQSKGVRFHVDAAQSAGKIPLDTQQIAADYISVCAHKIYGPKGIGALYVRRSSGALPPLIHGGGHERGMRSGTLPTHQIVAMGESFEMAQSLMSDEYERILKLKQRFLSELEGLGNAVQVNGDPLRSVPGVLNLSFKGLDGQVLLSALPKLAVSSGSACTSATMAPSHVLKAMGLSDDVALSSLRFSFGRYTSQEDVVEAALYLREVVGRLIQ